MPEDTNIDTAQDYYGKNPPKPMNALESQFDNLAEDEDIRKKVNGIVSSAFSKIRDRNEIEDVWQKNDEMYRIKPDSDHDEKHRANEGAGVYAFGIHVLTTIAHQTLTKNPDVYKYVPADNIPDREMQETIENNAKILTQLLHKAMGENDFKVNMRKIIEGIYKYGNGVPGVPWSPKKAEWMYRDKKTGNLKRREYTLDSLPILQHIPVENVWVDPNIDNIEDQPYIFIRSPIDWTDLISNEYLEFPETKKDQTLREVLDMYKENTGSEHVNVQQDRTDNADRTLEDRSQAQYKHWYCWIDLPLTREKNKYKWDDDAEERRFRVRILGDPGNPVIIEIRENMFPGGVPFLKSSQSSDDVGFYHISLGEKIETYHDQLCIAQNQMIDARSKANRRPIFYDMDIVNFEDYNFGHSNAIPVQGSPGDAVKEADFQDITGTIMASIQYYEAKIKEIMNTTNAVVGIAMGGRTTASEYEGAKAAAFTPIFADLANIEYAIMSGYMRKFAMYIHAYATHDDLVSILGPEAAQFDFSLLNMYNMELRGVSEAEDRIRKLQYLSQLHTMVQRPEQKDEILRRLAQLMDIENPQALFPPRAEDQATKAALWENNLMLIHGKYDAPELNEEHDIHLPIHLRAEYEAKQKDNPHLYLIQEHIADTRKLKAKQELQAAAGGAPFSVNGQQTEAAMPTPGQETGRNISARYGGVQAGSPIPAEGTMPE